MSGLAILGGVMSGLTAEVKAKTASLLPGSGHTVRVLGEVSWIGLYVLKHQVCKDFPELSDWFITIGYGEISTHARVDSSITRTDSFTIKRAKVTIDRSRKNCTRDAIKGLIAHELAHLLFIDRDLPHGEQDVALEIIDRGYDRAIEDLFLSECGTSCDGLVRKNVGGIDCVHYCPYGIRENRRIPPCPAS